MNIEELRESCLRVKGAIECFPFFDDTVIVFKVMEKMFAYAPLYPKDGGHFVNLKCDPEKSSQLCEYYYGITQGFHANKKYWISVYLDSDVPNDLIEELIVHSVEEVINKLPKKKQEEYANS